MRGGLPLAVAATGTDRPVSIASNRAPENPRPESRIAGSHLINTMIHVRNAGFPLAKSRM
jgi:hypothetical protein